MKCFAIFVIVLLAACGSGKSWQPAQGSHASVSDYYRALNKACRQTYSASGRLLVDCVDPTNSHFAGFDLRKEGYLVNSR
jgi:hypothetical protein